MNRDHDFLVALFAMQWNFIEKEHLLECGTDLAGDPSRKLTERLVEKGYLKAETLTSLEALIEAEFGSSTDELRRILLSFPVGEDIRRIFLELPLEEGIRKTLLEWRAGAGIGSEAVPRQKTAFENGDETMLIEQPSDGVSDPDEGLRRGLEDKYEFTGELGQGGLGEVLEAVDKDFGREVAVKMMRPGMVNPETVERFLLEGRAAGKLSHPNIIPIHEIGMFKHDDGEAPYFTMTKIVGRDLREILQALGKGDEAMAGRFNRHRLLRVFQEVCNAMAYAHDHNVIHRDLKPANIMVGDYGEVFVVDWGLAKLKGGKREKPGGMTQVLRRKPSGEPRLTLDGQIMGTPAYMPPEQAEGRIADIDEQSDIYSLGAILYEILTYTPPYEGASAHAIISKVLTQDVVPPSKADRVNRDRESPPEPVPAELEEIVLKALSKEKRLRFRSPRDLSDEIQAFLEGEKERERNHQMALEKITGGRGLVARMEKMRARFRDLESAVAEMEIKAFWPVEKKAGYWALQEEIRDTRRKIVRFFGRAAASLQEALGFERENREARAALADLYWDQYLREERAGDTGQMIYFEGLVREFNDGQYDTLLKGNGTLSVSTDEFACPCLTEGRMVAPDDMDVRGYHPFSGRALDGHEGEEDRHELEPKGRLRLKTHGTLCRKTALEGAEVWLFEFKERKRVLIPEFPEDMGIPSAGPSEVPADVLDDCFEHDSPYRAHNGLHLGKTPLKMIPIPMGSYLLIVAGSGFHPVRVPVYVERLADVEVKVTLYPKGSIPSGFVQISAGEFTYQGDRENPYSGEKEIEETEDLFVARFPVTCREYLEFLNELAGTDPEQADRRVPRESETSGHYWPKREDGKFVIPTAGWLSGAPEEVGREARRLMQAPVDWEEDWPVCAVSREDMIAYAAWFCGKSGHLISLPHEVQWEKSARGEDGRLFPWGNEEDAGFCNMVNSFENGPRPCMTGSFPFDESPYGVRGLGGNSRDWGLNEPMKQYAGFGVIRGGSWAVGGFRSRTTSRTGFPSTSVSHVLGGRLACFPRCRTR